MALFTRTTPSVAFISTYMDRKANQGGPLLTLPEHSNDSSNKNKANSDGDRSWLGEDSSPFVQDDPTMPQGTGTGFVWDTEGHVVTNFHVIRSAKNAEVVLTDRDGQQTVFPAKLRGFDVDKDVAVLKLVLDEGKPVSPPTPFFASSQSSNRRSLRRPSVHRARQQCSPASGFAALAIGTRTRSYSQWGSVRLGREVRSPSGRPILDAIQTDAAINQQQRWSLVGFSGAPDRHEHSHLQRLGSFVRRVRHSCRYIEGGGNEHHTGRESSTARARLVFGWRASEGNWICRSEARRCVVLDVPPESPAAQGGTHTCGLVLIPHRTINRHSGSATERSR